MIKERRKKKRLVKRGIALTMAITLVLGAGVIGIAQSIASVANQEDLTATVEGLVDRVEVATTGVSGLSQAVAEVDAIVTSAETAAGTLTPETLDAAKTAAQAAVDGTSAEKLQGLTDNVGSLQTELTSLETDLTKAVADTQAAWDQAIADSAVPEGTDPAKVDQAAIDAAVVKAGEMQGANSNAISALASVNGEGGLSTQVAGHSTTIAGLAGRATTAQTTINNYQPPSSTTPNTPPAGSDTGLNGLGNGTTGEGGTGSTSETSSNTIGVYELQEEVVAEATATGGVEVSLDAEAADTTGRTFNVTLNAKATEVTEVAANTILVIDNSASINQVELDAMKDAAKYFINKKEEGDQVAILTVADAVDGFKVGDAIAFSDNTTELTTYVDSIVMTTSATTNMEAVLDTVATMFTSASEAAEQSIVALSDGGFTVADQNKVTGIKTNATIYTIAYDEATVVGSANEAAMQGLATQAENHANAKLGIDTTAVGTIVNAIEAKTQKVVPAENQVESIQFTLASDFVSYDDAGEKRVFEFKNQTITATTEGLSVTATELYPMFGDARTGAQILESASIKLVGDTEATALDVTDLKVDVEADVVQQMNATGGFAAIPEVTGSGTGSEEAETIESNIGVEKNTTLDGDFDDRTYNIDLQAWSNKVTVAEEPISVVLVMDTSGSLQGEYQSDGKDVMPTLQSAAKDFIGELAINSPSSQVAVVDFDWHDEEENRLKDNHKNSYELPHDEEIINGTTHSGKISWGHTDYDEWKDNLNTALKIVGNAEEVDALGTYIDTMKSSGSTALGDGLRVANEILQTDESGNKQYVILFTDGVPTMENTTMPYSVYRASEEANEQAIVLANKDVMIYGIGYGRDLSAVRIPTVNPLTLYPSYKLNTTVNPLPKNLSAISGTKFLEEYIVHEYTAINSKEGLKDIFAALQKEVSDSVTIASTIVDEIDSRFTMTPKQMQKVAQQFYEKQSEGTYDLDLVSVPAKLTDGQSHTWTHADGSLKISMEGGIITLTWSGTAAELTRKDDGTLIGEDGEAIDKADVYWFDYDIPVTAKDDYLGGNVVPSNGDNSQVTTATAIAGENVLPFPEPHVNVATPDDTFSELNETIFVEEKADVETYIKQKLSEWTMLELDDIILGKDTEGNYTWNYDYNYGDDIVGDEKVKEGVITISVTKKNADDTDFITTAAGKNDIGKITEYELKFTYTADKNTERNQKLDSDNDPVNDFDLGLTDGDAGHGVADTATRTGNYIVNVIAGSINIEKWIDKLINTDRAGDAIFQFKIEKTDDVDGAERVWYRTVRIGEGTSTEGVGSEAAEAVNKILDKLPRGTYAITELSSMRYEYVDATVKTGVEAAPQDEGHIEVVIGYDADGSTKNNGNKDAVVVFNNNADDANHSTDTDVVINEFEVVNGEIKMIGKTDADGGNYLGGTEPTVTVKE